MNKIAAVVVTYNRKECLAECLNAIRQQSMIPDVIYVVDNHSTDGTPTWLFEQQYIAEIPNTGGMEDIISVSRTPSLNFASGQLIDIKYIYKAANTGGAGGFYTGMKAAYDDGYEWLWMMDDDGVPADDSLEQLFFYAEKNGLYYLNALVVDIKTRFLMAFGDKNREDYKDLDLLYDYATPFNGTLIHRQIPEKIGFIKKEMFIWGDDVEYQERVVKNGFRIATVVSSIHYHPKKNIVKHVRVIPFLKRPQVLKLEDDQRFSLHYRNMGYNYYTYFGNGFYKALISYTLYFALRFKFAKCRLFIVSFIKGSKNKFD
jgi:GT2 family glycosyltransferase